MAFPVDERVIMHYYAGDPLVNGESHFTASFGGSWFTNCNCNFYCYLTCLGQRSLQMQGLLD